jgi:hypothetical protein
MTGTDAPKDVRVLAGKLSQALETADPTLLGMLLHPNVRWGGEEETPQTCHSRSDVLTWYNGLFAAGVRARVDEVIVRENAVVLGLEVTGRPPGPDGPRTDRVFQVFRLVSGQVADIRGYPARGKALEVAEQPLA